VSQTVMFSCVIDTNNSDCPLGMEIWLDDQQIFNDNHIVGTTPFEYKLSDDDGEHSLKFVMKGKTQAHTQINELGEIVLDARLAIKDIEFDQIALNHIFTELSVYTHDFNGTGPQTSDKFYGEIGCNGIVELKFTTPVYIWLLENF
jgi:hypothetical protein